MGIERDSWSKESGETGIRWRPRDDSYYSTILVIRSPQKGALKRKVLEGAGDLKEGE